MQCFVVSATQARKRFDPLYYSQDNGDKDDTYPLIPIGDLVEYLKSGFAAGKSDQAETEEGIIQIRPTNVDEFGSLKFDKNIYIDSHVKELKPDQLLIKGEVLFNNTNSQEWAGKTAYFELDGDYFCSNHITRIKVKDSLISPKYLQIVLNLFQKRKVFFNICTNWNNQSGVNSQLLKTVEIPVPPMEIQNQIVAIMDQAHTQKRQKEAEAKALLDSIDDYVLGELGIELPEFEHKMCFSVRASEVVGKRVDARSYQNPKYELTTKYQICSLESLLIGPPQYGANESAIDGNPNEDFRYIRITDIGDWGDLRTDSWQTAKKIESKYTLEPGDILFARSGATAGKTFLYNMNHGNAIFAGYLIRFKFNPAKVNSQFVFYYCQTKIYKNWVEEIQRPSGQPNINSEEFKSINVPLPPLDIQEKICVKVQSKMDKAEALMQQAKEALQSAKSQVEKMI